jgi:hypothetical protein
MITARRSHSASRLELEPSARGFILRLWNRQGRRRVELTRKQAAALAERLNRALEPSQPPRPDVDEECWLDPQIM